MGEIRVLRAVLWEQSCTLLVTDVAWSKRSRIVQADSQSETVRQSGGDYALLSIDQVLSLLHLGRAQEGRQWKVKLAGLIRAQRQYDWPEVAGRGSQVAGGRLGRGRLILIRATEVAGLRLPGRRARRGSIACERKVSNAQLERRVVG